MVKTLWNFNILITIANPSISFDQESNTPVGINTEYNNIGISIYTILSIAETKSLQKSPFTNQ